MTKSNADIKEEVINKSESVFEDIKDNAEKAYEHLKPKADDVVKKVCDSASDFYNLGKEKMGVAEGYIEESLESLNKTIRNQPLSSLLIAAGIGYLWAKFKK